MGAGRASRRTWCRGRGRKRPSTRRCSSRDGPCRDRGGAPRRSTGAEWRRGRGRPQGSRPFLACWTPTIAAVSVIATMSPSCPGAARGVREEGGEDEEIQCREEARDRGAPRQGDAEADREDHAGRHGPRGGAGAETRRDRGNSPRRSTGSCAPTTSRACGRRRAIAAQREEARQEGGQCEGGEEGELSRPAGGDVEADGEHREAERREDRRADGFAVDGQQRRHGRDEPRDTAHAPTLERASARLRT